MANCRCQGVKAEALAENAAVTAIEVRQPKSLHALLDMPSHMDLCQIELIYRAEGNANLVLALPQFKKVLRLPKMHSNNAEAAQATARAQVCSTSATAAGTKLPQRVGVVTMQDFMAYIEIIRRLLGNEFVYEADIIAIPKASDRLWINEHIRPARPVTRLDKEFCGQFGLLLPDATQLPDTFDVLLSNLQATATGDTYAIEIKPKQGWRLLSSDVDNSFDLMPTTSDEGATAIATEAENTAKLRTTMAEATTETVALSVISEGRRTTTTAATTTTHQEADTTAAISTTQSPPSTTGKVPQAACRCRYCAMQFLKLSMGKVNSRSAYCPMDLFSGVPSRMFRALDALFACPQNNLRVFQNGNLIYGDHANSISWAELKSNVFQADIMVLINHLLVTCLLREYDDLVGSAIGAETATTTTTPTMLTSPKALTEQSKVKATVSVEVEVEAAESGIVAEAKANVAKGVVVDKAVVGQPSDSSAFAMEAQRTMATATTTTTMTTTTTTTKAETKAETEAPATQAQINKAETSCLPKNCVLQKILHFQLLAKQNFRFMWQSGYASKSATSYHALHALLASPAPVHCSEALRPAEQYLLGATALDCSIMMTFQEIEMPAERAHAVERTPWLVHLPAYNKYYLTKVTLLDLDPKPDSHFCKYIKQTHAIAQLTGS